MFGPDQTPPGVEVNGVKGISPVSLHIVGGVVRVICGFWRTAIVTESVSPQVPDISYFIV